jgi:HEPN domain-containing protein
MGKSYMSDEGRRRLVDDWHRFAGEDLSAARQLMVSGMFHHQACLLCQQSTEKYLKAYLLSKGWRLVKTHELSALVAVCCTHDNGFEDLYSSCELLNKYVVAGRYPGDLPFESTTSGDVKQAIDAAAIIEKFVLEKRGL